MNNRFEIVAAGSIGFAVAGTPAWIGEHRGFAAAITDNGVGDWTVTTDDPILDDQCVFLITPRGALAPSGNTAYGVAHTTDTAKRITCVQEDAAGAPSVVFDVPCDILVIKVLA